MVAALRKRKVRFTSIGKREAVGEPLWSQCYDLVHVRSDLID